MILTLLAATNLLPLTNSLIGSEIAGNTNDFHQKLWLAVWAALFGALASLVVNLLFTAVSPRLRRFLLTRSISVKLDQPQGVNLRLRLVNGGYWTIDNGVLYLSLDIQEQDVVAPPPPYIQDVGDERKTIRCQSFIGPGRFIPLEEDRICWSVRQPVNPMMVKIFAKERQAFSPCQITGDRIIIPSEAGWPPEAPARVYLQRRRYRGMLKFVSDDTNARHFRIEFGPSLSDPCTIEAMPECALENR